MKWQPIETAPKDGSVIVGLWQDDGADYATTRWNGHSWADPQCDRDEFGDPNYWMPLPPPPTEDA